MIKKSLLSVFAILLTTMWCLNEAQSNSVAMSAGHTGAPGENTCGAIGCHNSAPILNSLQFTTVVASPPSSTYTINQQYSMYVSLSASAPERGFQITALDPNGNPAGTFSLSSAATTALTVTGNGRQYVSHDTSSSSSAWAFRWTAPAAYVGNVTFYVAGLAADNDGTANGDITYLDTLIFPGAGSPSTADPDFTFSPNSPCVGTPVTFTNTSTGTITTYSWNFGSGATPPTASTAGPHSVTYSTTGSKTVTLTVSDGVQSVTETKTLTVTSGANADAGQDQIICAGDTATLTATGGGSYEWSTGGQTASIDVAPLQTTTYRVTVENGGCTGVDSVTVTVDQAPVANAGPDIIACAGDTIMAFATGGDTYRWFVNNQLISTDAALIAAPPVGNYLVTLEATSVNGCTDLDTLNVSINAAPTVNVADQSVCGVSSVTLDAGAGFFYEWSTGDTTQTTEVTTTGIYSVTVADANGCTATDDAEVTFVANLTINVADITICDGDTGFLDAAYPNADYEWSNSETSRIISVTQAGIYTVTVTDGACTGVDSVEVSVIQTPPPVLGNDTLICEGQTVPVFTSVTTPNASYQWDPIDGIADPNSSSTTATPAITTTYVLTVTLNGCSATDTILVEVNPAPTVTLTGGTGPYCEDDNTDYQLLGTPAGGTFDGPGLASQVVRGIPSGTDFFNPSDAGPGVHDIVYTYTDGTGCSGSDTLTITVNPLPTPSIGNLPQQVCINDGIITLALSPAGGTLSGTGTDAGAGTFDPALAGGGVFTITYEFTDSAGCFGTTSETVEVIDVPTSFTGLSSSYCSDDLNAYQLTGSPSGGVFSGPGINGSTFSPADAGTGTHQVTYSYFDNQSGCTFTNIQTVSISGIQLNLVDTTICLGNSVELTVSNGFNYLWSTGDTTATITVSPSDTTIYTVTGIDSFGCTASASATVNVVPAPVVSFSGLSSSYCSNDRLVTLIGSPAGGTFSGNGVTAGGDFDPGTAPIGGPYPITYTYSNAFGCTDSSSQFVQVILAPQATITALDSEYCVSDLPVTLNGSPAGGVYMGPGISNGVFVPYYAGAGVHTIRYRVPQQSGCDASVDYTVTIHDVPAVTLDPVALSYCTNSEAITLTGAPAGGTYSGPGVSADMFDPAAAPANSPVVLQYEYTDSNGCTNTAYQFTEVNPLPALSLPNVADEYCSNAPAVTLSGLPVNGVFSGTGVIGNTFDPAAAGAGAHQLIFSYTSANGCSDSIVKAITVNAAPTVSFSGLDSTYCLNADLLTLNASPAGGTFSGIGVIGNVFNPIAAGTGGPYVITYIYTAPNGCSDTVTESVTIYPTANLVISGLAQRYCVGEATVASVSGFPGGGLFTGAGIDVTADDTTFTPSAAGVGEHIILYAYTNPLGCISYQLATVVVDDCVGVEETDALATVKVYPNPTDGMINVELSGLVNGDAKVSVYNVQGQVISNRVLNGLSAQTTLQLDLSTYAKGLYLLKVEAANVSKIERIVIQ